MKDVCFVDTNRMNVYVVKNAKSIQQAKKALIEKYFQTYEDWVDMDEIISQAEKLIVVEL